MAAKKQDPLNLVFLRGIIRDNPVLVLLLGTCPFLATTTSFFNGLGIGLATTFVLLMTNVVISLLRNFIPNKVRIPAYIIVIAGFVSVVELLIRAYVPSLYQSLGIFIPLITVNCIVLGRAEAFASQNTVLRSVLDALGMGLGFTLACVLMGVIREFFGSGMIFGYAVPWLVDNPFLIFIMPTGGFFVYALLIILVIAFQKYLDRRRAEKEAAIIERYLALNSDDPEIVKAALMQESDACTSASCEGCGLVGGCGMEQYRAQMRPRRSRLNLAYHSKLKPAFGQEGDE
ncbi:MAG: electron transport complex subunit E [Coriobacteriia bacterium]|nr:electron transport complex subunit E [Coriobacteriia bacterium]